MKGGWLDRSPAVLLACCSRCGWREAAASTQRGWLLLADHCTRVHDDPEGRRVAQSYASQQVRRERVRNV